MPKPRKRKETEFDKKPARSVFFTGNPNREKLEVLRRIQDAYTDGVNQFLKLLNDTPELMLQIVKNDKHDGDMREFEKAHRDMALKSAMSQAAFDDAVTMLHNRMDNILRYMRGICFDPFTNSLVLFVMSIQKRSRAEMIDAMNEIAEATTRDPAFYLESAASLSRMTPEEFSLRMAEFDLAYADATAIFRVPSVKKKMWVSLDSRTCFLEEAKEIQTSHVLYVTDPSSRGTRICIPVTTSRNSLRRMAQYGYAQSCHYTITGKGLLRVSVAFKKPLEQPETTKVMGVDTGIIDCLYASDGTRYGTFTEVEDYYKTKVEPSLGALSSLRNKKQKILHFLKTHKDLPASVRRSQLDKVNRLEGMIQAAKEPDHKLRSYHHRLDVEISSTVRRYMANIDRSTLTVLELLDIREFDKSRKANGKLSMFARGKLQQTLMARLNWHGYDLMEVEPAYTSQLCPVCFNVDHNNRNKKLFRCTCCGHEDDADHNAACNIRSRAGDEEVLEVCRANPWNQDARHAALKSLYGERHREYLKLHP